MNDSKAYSIRLNESMKQEIKGWAAQYDQKPAWLIKRILAGALAARCAESTQSSLPMNALPHLPTFEAPDAYQVENES